jgi:hypothetical protein
MDEHVADCQLKEHPSATWARLKASGQWEAAEKMLRSRKQNLRNKFAREGGPLTLQRRVEMTKVAWDAVHTQWPPPKGTPPLLSVLAYLEVTKSPATEDGLTLEARRRFDTIGDNVDLAADVTWVYHHVDNAQADPLECPSRGAWSMLLHARLNKARFFEKVFLPVANQQARRKAANGEDVDYAPTKTERKAIGELEEMLRDAVAQSQELIPSSLATKKS